MQKIVPNIWCNRNAEEAGAAYAAVFSDPVLIEAGFPGATSTVEYRYPGEGLLDFQRDFAGEALTVAVDVGGAELVLINAGDEFRPNPSISLILNFAPARFGGEAGARASLDAVWSGLSAGGRELMPLGEYPFSERYGWVEDRFGVSWQLMLASPEGDPPPFVMPALMFGGAAQNRAAEAVQHYLSVFDDAVAGSSFPYGTQTGPATADALMFSDFRIGEQWFAAMDSGVEQDFTFTCGVSLEVRCADQAEIDRLWEALSAVPEAEACGWLADRFGVSWQIVPAGLEDLMRRPGAYEHLMGMKKIVIDDF